MRRFATRNRAALVTIGLVFAALCVGLAIALVQRNEAVHARDLARQTLEEVRRHKEHAETLLYAADVRLAARALDEGDAYQAIELLNRHLPSGNGLDLRGIEWEYLTWRARGASLSSAVSDVALYTVCASPDRRRLATAGADGRIYILDVATLRVEHSFDSNQVEVNGLSLSGDGRQLVSSGDDGTVRIWSFPAGEPLSSVRFGQERAYHALLAPDCSQIIACGNATDVRVFSAETGDMVASLDIHERAIEGITLSADGRYLACASGDASMSVWEWQEARLLHQTPPIPDQRLTCVAFSADGRWIADGSNTGAVRVTEVESWSNVGQISLADGVQGLASSPDGESIAVVTRSGTVQAVQVDVVNRSVELRVDSIRDSHEGRAYCVCWADTASTLSVGRDGHVYRTTLTRHDGYGVEIPNVQAKIVSVSPDGAMIMWANEDRIGLYDRRGERHVSFQAFPPASYWSAVSFSPDGRQLVAATNDGRLTVASVDSLDQVRVHELRDRIDVSSLRFSRDGQRLAIVSRHGDCVRVAACPSLEVLFQLSVVDNSNAALSPDGRLVALNDGRDLLVFDVDSGQAVAESVRHHEEPIRDVMYVAGGEQLVSIAGDRTVRTWNWRHGEPMLLGVHSGAPRSVAVTADARTLLTCTRDGKVVVWSLPSRQKLFTFTEIPNEFLMMQLAPDDSILATVEAGGVVRWFPLTATQNTTNEDLNSRLHANRKDGR